MHTHIYIYLRICHSVTLKRLICQKSNHRQPENMRLQIIYMCVFKKAMALNNLLKLICHQIQRTNHGIFF